MTTPNKYRLIVQVIDGDGYAKYHVFTCPMRSLVQIRELINESSLIDSCDVRINASGLRYSDASKVHTTISKMHQHYLSQLEKDNDNDDNDDNEVSSDLNNIWTIVHDEPFFISKEELDEDEDYYVRLLDPHVTADRPWFEGIDIVDRVKGKLYINGVLQDRFLL